MEVIYSVNGVIFTEEITPEDEEACMDFFNQLVLNKIKEDAVNGNETRKTD